MTRAETIQRGAVWIDRRARGRISLAGADASRFLHALVTNDVARLLPGEGCYATYLTPQGRMIADMRVYHRGDRLILDVAPGVAPALAAKLDLLIFSEDVRVTDESAAIAQISVIGGASSAALARVVDASGDAIAALDTGAQTPMGQSWVARTDEAPMPSFDLFMPAIDYATAIARLAEAGAVPLTEDEIDALRIEAGRPAFGVDMTTETIPLEAGLLDRAISTTKGCYVGQEVIIRILHRGSGRVAKRLVRLTFDDHAGAVPASGAPIVSGGREVGRITSAARSLFSGRVIALGYVHRDQAEIGQKLTVAGEEAETTGLAR